MGRTETWRSDGVWDGRMGAGVERRCMFWAQPCSHARCCLAEHLSTSPIPSLRRTYFYSGVCWASRGFYVRTLTKWICWVGWWANERKKKGLWAKQGTCIKKNEFRSKGSICLLPHSVQNGRENAECFSCGVLTEAWGRRLRPVLTRRCEFRVVFL